MMNYFMSFLVGGTFCLIAQILIDKTNLTPARILVGYVCAGVILSGLGLYKYILDVGYSGASVPLCGFGNLLAEGVRKSVNEKGLLGAFTGGLSATAGGIGSAVVFGYIFGLIFKGKSK